MLILFVWLTPFGRATFSASHSILLRFLKNWQFATLFGQKLGQKRMTCVSISPRIAVPRELVAQLEKVEIKTTLKSSAP
jgi:hypothetical protein